MTKRWKMPLGALAALGAVAVAARADVIGPSEWEVALYRNLTGLLLGIVVLVMFVVGMAVIVYGVCCMCRKERKK